MRFDSKLMLEVSKRNTITHRRSAQLLVFLSSCGFFFRDLIPVTKKYSSHDCHFDLLLINTNIYLWKQRSSSSIPSFSLKRKLISSACICWSCSLGRYPELETKGKGWKVDWFQIDSPAFWLNSLFTTTDQYGVCITVNTWQWCWSLCRSPAPCSPQSGTRLRDIWTPALLGSNSFLAWSEKLPLVCWEPWADPHPYCFTPSASRRSMFNTSEGFPSSAKAEMEPWSEVNLTSCTIWLHLEIAFMEIMNRTGDRQVPWKIKSGGRNNKLI